MSKAVREANDAGTHARSESRGEDGGAGIVQTSLDTSMHALPVASTAYVGRKVAVNARDRERVVLRDLERLNIEVIPWNGR